MTHEDWHAPTALLARFRDDPGSIDGVTASSVEAHLLACVRCRRELTDGADTAAIASQWNEIADRIDRPPPRLVERATNRLGIGGGLARLLSATPSLQVAGLLAVTAVAVGAVVASRTADARAPFLVIAPLVPLAAVAATFARVFDPAGETGVATPLHGAGLMVRRAAAVIVATFTVLLAAAPFGGLGPSAAAWVLPSLALTLGALALGTWVRIEAAVASLAFAWLTGVFWLRWLGGQRASFSETVAFTATGQVVALATVVAATLVLIVRRHQFATLEAFR